jgi:hypothetical protein
MRISALIDATLYDHDGGRLGRVTEVRATHHDDAAPQVTELLLGRPGLRHRLTGRGRHTHAIDLTQVTIDAPGRLRADRSALRTR